MFRTRKLIFRKQETGDEGDKCCGERNIEANVNGVKRVFFAGLSAKFPLSLVSCLLSPLEMKRILIVSGVLLLLLSGFFFWRALNPPLTDEQQIAANLDAIAAAADARDAVTIADFMAPTFSFNGNSGMARKEFQRQLYSGMLQYRVIDLQINGVQVQVNGESAQSDGRFLLNTKSEFDSPSEANSGNFKLKWQKIDGEWKITEVEGAPVPK